MNCNALVEAVKALLNKRSATNCVYDEAYDFTFKSWGRDEWNQLIELVGWTPEEGLKYRIHNDCLLDCDQPLENES